MIAALHVLDHSLPQQSGYASRSHAILRSLRNDGVDAQALTSPKHGPSGSMQESIDGVPYSRSIRDVAVATHGVPGQLRTITTTRAALRAHIDSHAVDLLHAHSPCLNGLAAIGLNLPLVYEMRSSWEDAAVSEGATREGSLRYRVSRWLETFVAKRASAITVICGGLKEELVKRGIAESKITVVPNAVPESMFEPATAESVSRIRASLALPEAPVIGYFGSFFQWEGVADLVRAMPDIRSKVDDAILLLAGGGRQETALRELVSELKLERAVIFAGRVPHHDVPSLYALANVMVFPRVSNRLTEMVTPLKPLEAMAQGVPVVASDIGGHAELIKNGETGILYDPSDGSGLVDGILEVLENGPDVQAMVRRAAEWVTTERRWASVSKRYLDVYQAVTRAT